MPLDPLEPFKKALGHSKVKSQPLWEKIYKFGVRGMNFGAAQCATSGEVPALEYVHSHLKSQTQHLTLVDGGANRGEYTLLMRSLFGKDAVIHSFEPLASTFEMLQDATDRQPNIVCHPFGLSDKEETLKIFFHEPGSTIASVYPQREDHPWRTDLTATVELRTLDEICQEEGIKRIDFLKLDVEGHEYKALVGAQKLLADNAIGFIQWEFGPKHVDSRTFFRDFYELLNPQYQIYRIVKDGVFAINHYDEYYELFGATINYLAQNKAQFPAG